VYANKTGRWRQCVGLPALEPITAMASSGQLISLESAGLFRGGGLREKDGQQRLKPAPLVLSFASARPALMVSKHYSPYELHRFVFEQLVNHVVRHWLVGLDN